MRFAKEIKIIVLAVIAVASLYFGYMFLRGTDFLSTSRVFYAYYPNIQGLEVSNPVVLNGLEVGRVQALELQSDRNNPIRVTMEIKEEVQIGDGTTAGLASSSLLGGMNIQLSLGQNKKLYQGGETLKASVQSSITDQLASQATPLISKLDSTITSVNGFLTPEAQRNMAATLRNFEASSRALNQLIMANQQNINRITSNVSQLTGAFLKTEHQFNRLAGSLNSIADSVKHADVSKTIKEANLAMSELRQTVAKINNADGTLGLLMNDKAMYNNLTRATGDLDRLLVDFKTNPKRYVNVSVFGRKDNIKPIDVKVDEPGSQMAAPAAESNLKPAPVPPGSMVVDTTGLRKLKVKTE